MKNKDFALGKALTKDFLLKGLLSILLCLIFSCTKKSDSPSPSPSPSPSLLRGSSLGLIGAFAQCPVATFAAQKRLFAENIKEKKRLIISSLNVEAKTYASYQTLLVSSKRETLAENLSSSYAQYWICSPDKCLCKSGEKSLCNRIETIVNKLEHDHFFKIYDQKSEFTLPPENKTWSVKARSCVAEDLETTLCGAWKEETIYWTASEAHENLEANLADSSKIKDQIINKSYELSQLNSNYYQSLVKKETLSPEEEFAKPTTRLYSLHPHELASYFLSSGMIKTFSEASINFLSDMSQNLEKHQKEKSCPSPFEMSAIIYYKNSLIPQEAALVEESENSSTLSGLTIVSGLIAFGSLFAYGGPFGSSSSSASKKKGAPAPTPVAPKPASASSTKPAPAPVTPKPAPVTPKPAPVTPKLENKVAELAEGNRFDRLEKLEISGEQYEKILAQNDLSPGEKNKIHQLVDALDLGDAEQQKQLKSLLETKEGGQLKNKTNLVAILGELSPEKTEPASIRQILKKEQEKSTASKNPASDQQPQVKKPAAGAGAAQGQGSKKNKGGGWFSTINWSGFLKAAGDTARMFLVEAENESLSHQAAVGQKTSEIEVFYQRLDCLRLELETYVENNFQRSLCR